MTTTENQDFYNWLHKRLQHELPGIEAQQTMMNIGRPFLKTIPKSARQSAVLILMYPYSTNESGLIFIERSIDKTPHSGQIAFPGGKKEKIDKDFIDTALREAHEEINLPRDKVNIIGNLSPLYIPISNFNVNPILAFTDDLPPLKPCDIEVADIIISPMEHLFSKKEMVDIPLLNQFDTIQAKAYILNDKQIIWGASAMMLAELEHLWIEWKKTRNHLIA